MLMRWSWLALGVGAYLAFVLASFPAATAYHWFAPEALRLSGISGTAWSGSAALASVPGLTLRELRWELDAGPLLLGRISGGFEARLEDGFISTSAVVTRGRLRLEDLQASTTLATLRDLLPLGDAQGQLSLMLVELVLVDGLPANAVGMLAIGDLAVPPLLSASEEPLIEVGNFAVELTDSGGQGLVGTLRDEGGPLEVTGMLSLGRDRRYVLSGRARARPGAPDELVQGVDMMTGEPDSDGLRPFEFPGSL